MSRLLGADGCRDIRHADHSNRPIPMPMGFAASSAPGVNQPAAHQHGPANREASGERHSMQLRR